MVEKSEAGKKGWYGRENSIEVQGLQKYLDDRIDKHNGKGYSYFTELVDQDQNRTAIAKAFQVNFKTADKWMKVYRNEQKAKDKKNAITRTEQPSKN